MAKKNKSQYKRPRNYFMIDHKLYLHPSYLSLSHMGIHLLVDMFFLYNGFNNGDISIVFNDMKKRAWKSSGSLDKAKNELLERGLIYLTRRGKKYGDCALYALSWIPLDECKNKLETDKKIGFIALELSKK